MSRYIACWSSRCHPAEASHVTHPAEESRRRAHRSHLLLRRHLLVVFVCGGGKTSGGVRPGGAIGSSSNWGRGLLRRLRSGSAGSIAWSAPTPSGDLRPRLLLEAAVVAARGQREGESLGAGRSRRGPQDQTAVSMRRACPTIRA